jgi:hypothetical protein
VVEGVGPALTKATASRRSRSLRKSRIRPPALLNPIRENPETPQWGSAEDHHQLVSGVMSKGEVGEVGEVIGSHLRKKAPGRHRAP